MPQAEVQLRKILATTPGHEESHFVLGMILAMTGRWAESATHIEPVVATYPARDEALFWLAVVRRSMGDHEVAANLCERAIAVNPRNPTVLNELGLCRMGLNQPDQAAQAFSRAANLAPNSGVYQCNLGHALVRLDRIYKAQDAFREAIRLDPNRVDAFLELARILEILDQRQEVVSVLTQGVDSHPAEFQLLTALAGATAYIGNRTEAEELFRRAMIANPVSGNSFGLWLQEEGRFNESIECFFTSIKAMPVQGIAYYGLAEAKVFDFDGVSMIERIEPFVDSEELDLKGRTYLCYALAMAHEQRRDAKNTIQFYDRANSCAYLLYNQGRPFDREELDGITNWTISQYSEGALSRPVEGASESNCPIFIVGMIRSGTTLLDQIISSHPKVRSAGEPVFWMREGDRVRRAGGKQLPASQVRTRAAKYLESLETTAGSSPRITDKMPLNYAHLGLIHQTFPNAKIVHLRRNALDTCFSIYTTFLGQGPNFAYSQSNIVFNYRKYLRVMDHWRRALPPARFLEIDYESLINDREATTRQVTEFCGLDWDNACLSYERNESSIRTPSKWQVRQPIYRSSISRWKPYEPWLGELLELRELS